LKKRRGKKKDIFLGSCESVVHVGRKGIVVDFRNIFFCRKYINTNLKRVEKRIRVRGDKSENKKPSCSTSGTGTYCVCAISLLKKLKLKLKLKINLKIKVYKC
jgi:hypothetical protein